MAGADIYALELLVELERRGALLEPLAGEAEAMIPVLVHALEGTALDSGGWNYAGRDAAAPFMTAPALQALFAARANGHEVSEAVLEHALDSLERGRALSGSIAYTVPSASHGAVPEDELRFMDKLPGATGRMLAVECTLQQFGRGDPGRLSRALGHFFTHWDELEKRRKQTGTHIEPYGVAPYYVVYAHRYAAQAIQRLVEPRERAARRIELLALLERIREPDGGWNDRVFARSENYGTAMVLLALLELEPASPPER